MRASYWAAAAAALAMLAAEGTACSGGPGTHSVTQSPSTGIGPSVWVGDDVLDHILRIDPHSNRVVATFSIGNGPSTDDDPDVVAVGDGSLWVGIVNGHELSRSRVVRMDPSTGRALATFAQGSLPESIAVTPQAVWVAEDQGVVKIDPASNRVVATIGKGEFVSVAFGEGSVWAAGNDGVLRRIEPIRDRVLATIQVGSPAFGGLTFAGGDVWASGGESTVAVVDPGSNSVIRSVKLSGGERPGQLASVGGSVWANTTDAIFRIDPRTGRVARLGFDISSSQQALTAGAGAVWVPEDAEQGDILRIDPVTGRVAARIRVSPNTAPVAIAFRRRDGRRRQTA